MLEPTPHDAATEFTMWTYAIGCRFCQGKRGPHTCPQCGQSYASHIDLVSGSTVTLPVLVPVLKR